MPDDTITVSAKVAEALNLLEIGQIWQTNLPERMAWVVLVMRQLEDRAEWFPAGKWATIQSIEAQLTACAKAEAEKIGGNDA